jgi:hypothetical protein
MTVAETVLHPPMRFFKEWQGACALALSRVDAAKVALQKQGIWIVWPPRGPGKLQRLLQEGRRFCFLTTGRQQRRQVVWNYDPAAIVCRGVLAAQLPGSAQQGLRGLQVAASVIGLAQRMAAQELGPRFALKPQAQLGDSSVQGGFYRYIDPQTTALPVGRPRR